MKGYLFDLHVHTCETSPCGEVPGAEMARLYHEAGYDGVVITDHYYTRNTAGYATWREAADHLMEGWRSAKAAGERLGLTVLLGSEIRFDHDPADYLVYGVDEDFFYAHEALCSRMDLPAFCRAFAGKLLVVNAHPYREGREPKYPELVSGLEVLNNHPRHENANHRSMELACRMGISLRTAGSDAHQPQDAARAGVVFPEPVHSNADLLRQLAKPNPLYFLPY